MVKNNNKKQAFLLGQLGELLSRSFFSLTEKGTRAYDFTVPTLEDKKKIEVKTGRPIKVHGSRGFAFQYTKDESRSDFFILVCLTELFETEAIYFIPGKKIPKRRRNIWIGKYSSKKKWRKFRIV